MDGLLVLGTDWQCGKTTLMTGLAAAFIENGLRVQALKLLAFGEETAFHRGQEQAFINQVTQQFIQADTFYAPSPEALTMPLWHKLIDTCRHFQYPCFVEGPGQVATPWQIVNGQITDGADVAKQLGLNVLLAAKAGPRFIEQTRSALSFLEAKGITPVGFIRVHTQPGTMPEDDNDPVMISHQHATPFLGDLPYSPSISVPGMQQGNLIRLTQDYIDLLPLEMGIGLKL